MYISFAESCTKGFKKWSVARGPVGSDNDGDVPNGASVTVGASEINYAVPVKRMWPPLLPDRVSR
jgi:hypothetical protein